MIDETINLLGLTASDKVTGLTGVVTSVCFDLFGCVQAALSPPQDEKGALPEGRWMDVNRLTISPKARVMAVPVFSAKDARPENYTQGAAPKPAPAR